MPGRSFFTMTCLVYKENRTVKGPVSVPFAFGVVLNMRQAAALHLLLFVVSVKGNAIVIKAGGSNANEHEQHQDGGVYDSSAKKGISNFEAEQGFNLENDRKYVKAEDGGKYAEENANKNHHLDQNDYAGEKFHNQNGGTVVDLGNQVCT